MDRDRAETAFAVTSAVSGHSEADGVKRPYRALAADRRRSVEHPLYIVHGVQFVTFERRRRRIMDQIAVIDLLNKTLRRNGILIGGKKLKRLRERLFAIARRSADLGV